MFGLGARFFRRQATLSPRAKAVQLDYIDVMTSQTDIHPQDTAPKLGHDGEMARIIWQMAGIGAALLMAAAGLLWWHFGPVIFFDTLATLQSCF